MAIRRRVVPLKRNLRKGMIGPDVVALKRALRRSKNYSPPGGRCTNQFGKELRKAVVRYQKKKKLKADGVYGPATHRALLRWYDKHGAYLMGRAPMPSGETFREKIVNEARWGYNHRSGIHYRQTRPIRRYGHALPQTLDCSGFATECYRKAGVEDPNRLGYNGQGFTGTLAAHGRSVSLAGAKPGDLVFYGGGYPYHHVAVYVGYGRVISHGSEGGPYLVPVDYRSDRRLIKSYLP